ncbi:uncharacterized protein ColSpa_08217 [Colletotrichum spaethianum]|uniref:Uncharacterized protein n=1 Tax=Colletotrichum spaethianum TaxID=700344 RepID=A0AA37P9C1_9PEZI|nr:uncharacterized protein ColSpa_08217 [Colletotrichum spaethianum]GKT48036.1 hypothetical protein ColSpa_08217 [Colletotrichum spaethianum]
MPQNTLSLLDDGAVGNVEALALVVLLVLEGDLAELGENVLDEGVGDAALLAAHVVEDPEVGQDVVDEGHDDGDGDRVHEDDANGDEVGAAVLGQEAVDGRGGGGLATATREPAEDAEKNRQNVDGGDGANELEGGEGLEATGDEDEPILGQGDLEEEDLLDGAVLVDDATVDNVHGTAEDPGTHGEETAENDGDDPDLGELPLDGTLLESEEDDEVGADSLVDDDHGSDEVDLQVQAKSDTVLDVGLHALENLARQLDGRDDSAKTGGKEDDIGGGLGSLGGTLDGNTAVGLLQGGSVVDTVTSHGSQVTTLLEHLDDLVLVLGEHFGETVGALAKVVDRSAGHVAVEKLVGVVNLGTELEHAAGLDGNGVGVTSKHLNLETESLGLENGLAGIAARGVEEGQHAEHLPGAILLLDGDGEGTETTAGELSGLLLEESGLLLSAVGEGEDGLGGTLGASVTDTTVGGDGGDTLGDGVEGGELLGLPAVRDELLGLRVTLEGEDGDLVDGVQGLDVVRRGESGDGHHPVDVNTLHDERLADGQLVGSEGTGLVGAEDVDTSQGLDGSELLDDGLLLGEVGSTDGEGGGGNTGQTDGDTDDEENQSVVEQVDGSALLGDLNGAVESTNPGSEDKDDDKSEKRSTDRVHDGLEVTLVLGALDEGGGLSNERGLGAVGDDTESLAALATGGVVAGVGHELVDGERLTSHGRLVNGDDGVSELGVGVLLITLLELLAAGGHDILGLELSLVGGVAGGVLVVANQLAISGDDVAFLNDDLERKRVRDIARIGSTHDITGHEFTSADLLFFSLANDTGLHGDVTLQGGDNVGSLLLLVPTDSGVKQKNGDNQTGVEPILQGEGEDSGTLHDCIEN